MSELEALKSIIMRAPPQMAGDILTQLETLPESDDPSSVLNQLKLLLRSRLLASFAQPAKAKAVPQPLKEGREISVSRLFFKPFESLFETFDNTNKPLPGSFDRANLRKIWNVFKDKIASEELEELEPKAQVALMQSDKNSAAYYGSKLREVFYQKTIDKDENILHQLDNDIDQEVGKRFIHWLQVDHEARQRKIDVTADLGDFSDNDISSFCLYLTKLDKSDVKTASDFLLLLMGNSHKPWSVLRIIKSAVVDMNDRKLAVTAYNIIGIRLIALLERKVEHINSLRKSNNFDGHEAALLIEDYNQMSVGFERCNLLIDGGPWTKALRQVRIRAGEVFNDMCEHAQSILEQAFPIDKGRVKGLGNIDLPRTSSELVEDRVKSAIEFAKFIRDARLYAPNAGFGGTRDNVHKAMLRHCDWLKSGLVTLFSHEDRGRFFDDWSKKSVEIISIIDDAASAKSLERKLAA